MTFVSLGHATATAGCLPATSVAAKPADRGREIFEGSEPLEGAIRGHRDRLPPVVVRCRNCHATSDDGTKPSGTAAPKLDAALLIQQRPRRGGPPSAYDRQTFCKLLRTGIDPAFVLIGREMPVYDLSDAQCASLWGFLTSSRTTGG